MFTAPDKCYSRQGTTGKLTLALTLMWINLKVIMNIIVIGGSAGALPALTEITSALPGTMESAVFIVVHFPEDKVSHLPEVLNRKGKLHAVHAVNNCLIEKGKLYIAPPGLHMIIENGHILLSDGPKENKFRPSIDVLFRSAAITYRSQVTGIILSGALDDGTAGLQAVKKLGGITIVQLPDEAIVDSMPLNAIRRVKVDHCVPAAEIPLLLQAISDKKQKQSVMTRDETIEWENSFAQGNTFDLEALKKHADPTRHVCPLCEGPLFKIKDEELIRYRCYTGHALSPETLLKETNEKIEHLLWTTYRTIDEKKEMLKHFFTDKGELAKEEMNIDKKLSLLRQVRQSFEQD